MREWADVATLTKTRNLNGRFVARAAAGLPFLLSEGDEVRFVPPVTDMPRAATVSEAIPFSEREAEVAFAEIESRDVAAQLVGSHVLVRRAGIDPQAFQEPSAMWEGWTVVDDVAGEIGRVVGIVDNPGQALIEVETPEGAQVLVPAVDEIVRDVDVDGRTIAVALPNGLLEL